MSRTISLYFSASIDAADFTRAALDLGGQSLDEESLDFVFSEQQADVWIYGARGGLNDPRELPDPYNSPRPFGQASKANIDMHLSSAPESAPLALRIADCLLRRWPGVASFPLQTVLVRGDTADALPQTAAESITGSEIQILLSQEMSIGAVIKEFGGTVIDQDNADLFGDRVAKLTRTSRVRRRHDNAVGVLDAGRGHLWVLMGEFDPVDIYRWDLLAPTVNRHVRPSPTLFVVRVVIDCSPSDMESVEVADVLALSFSKRISQAYCGVLLGTFFVALEPDQVKLVLDTGLSPLIS